jgi:hypothetical protein
MAHHTGEDAEERLITSQLKNAGNSGGIPALLEETEAYLSKLNAVHCTMVINRCVLDDMVKEGQKGGLTNSTLDEIDRPAGHGAHTSYPPAHHPPPSTRHSISKALPPEREQALTSPAFAALMDRTMAVLGDFGARDTAQAAISLARFKDAKRIARWQPLVRALQEKARVGMGEMLPKVRAGGRAGV